MRLWTWQKKGFLLDSGRVESLRNSGYLNDFSRGFADRLLMLRAYVRFWEFLESDQILWCYTDRREAISAKDQDHFWCGACQLWEIDVPPEKANLICGVGWHWMLTRRECAAPSRFESLRIKMLELHLTLASNHRHYDRDRFYSDFNAYWAGKTQDELVEGLFAPNACYECAQAVVLHPIDKKWIVKDPTKVVEWWADSEDR